MKSNRNVNKYAVVFFLNLYILFKHEFAALRRNIYFLNPFTTLKAETTYLRVLLTRPIANQG